MGTTKDEVLGSLHRCIMHLADGWAKTAISKEQALARAEGAMLAFGFIANRLKLNDADEALDEYRAMLGSEF